MHKKILYKAIFKQIEIIYGQKSDRFSLPELIYLLANLDEPIHIAERTLRRKLANWCEQGLLTKTGQKRGTRYHLNKQAITPAFLTGIPAAKKQIALNKLRDLWTHSSTSLEGNTLTLGDTHSILELGLTISGKPLREHHEVIGHAKAIDLLYQMIHQSITKEHLFDLHKAVQTEIMMDIYQPVGEWKVEKNYAYSINSQDEQVTIEYANPEDVDTLMQTFLAELNAIDTNKTTAANAHKIYAHTHIQFTHIHPFADGNGRIARLIANIPLLKAGLPPLLIDQNKRREYITLLADYQSIIGKPIPKKQTDQQNNAPLKPFIQFCEQCYQTSLSLIKQTTHQAE